MKLTVGEYAAKHNLTVQSVYQRIKRGSLKSIESNGVKYVVVDSESIKGSLNTDVESMFKEPFKEMSKIIEKLQNQISKKDKEIKRLTKALEKCNKTKEDVFLQYIQEIKTAPQLAAPVPDHDDNVIEVKEERSKKKKSKNKKNRKGKK